MIRRSILSAAAIFGLALPAVAFAGLHAGDVAPNFRGTDLNGVSHTLFEYRGKVVVLFVLAYF
jgi:hypothetical protein